jgi:hypothetical protein
MRIGFIVYAPSQINSFIKSKVFEELREKTEITLFCTNKELQKELSGIYGYESILLRIPWAVRKVVGYHQMITLWRFKDRSMNHLVRAMASFGNNHQRALWKCVVVSEMSLSSLKRILVKIMSFNPFYSFVSFAQELIWKINFLTKWRKVFTKEDTILVPFSGHIGADFSTLVWNGRRHKKYVVAIQENWDNLSTKTYITQKPDLFLVWGKQSAAHLRNVHRCFDVPTEVVGSPRFGPYFDDSKLSNPTVSLASGKMVSLKNKKFVLVAGTGDGIDDEMLVKSVQSCIKNLRTKSQEIVIIYRPHPMTRTRIDFQALQRSIKNILIDSGPHARDFGHHNALVKNAIATVNHFSTVAIESLIAGVPSVIPLFLGRKDANYRYEHILSEWHHMMGLALIPQILTPNTKEEFEKVLKSILTRPLKSKSVPIDWICTSDLYVEKVIRSVKKNHVKIS